MKKVLIVVIIGLLCLSVFSTLAPQAKASGVITDFESGLGGWQPFSSGGGINQISTMHSHSGSHSLEQFCPSGGNGASPPVSQASVKYPAAEVLSQYELSLWVYVTERKYEAAASQFGFLFNDEWVLWDVWGPGPRGSYVYVRESEGYQILGDYNNPILYGLSPDIWHHVKVVAYNASGTISVWLDGNLIVDNWLAFNAGEKPDYYYVHAHANYPEDYVCHFVDDIYISEAGAHAPSLHASISPLSASILVGQSVTFTSAVSGGYAPYTYQWYLDGDPVSGATSASWTFTPPAGGIYYTYLRVTDSVNDAAQAYTARVTAVYAPVGGYSVPLRGYSAVKPSELYLTILAIITVVFTAIRRKTRREK